MAENTNILILCTSFMFLGFFHTIISPDHYFPVIALCKANNWNEKKAALIAAICGVGHVLSSVLIGFIGILIGKSVGNIEAFNEVRESAAAYLLIGIGILYTIWGIKKYIENKPHSHKLLNGEEVWHNHSHKHKGEHHCDSCQNNPKTIWALFAFFLFSPCKTLIPVLTVTSASMGSLETVSVILAFFFSTVLTMSAITWIAFKGLKLLKPDKASRLERFSHVIAGGTILISGVAIAFSWV